MMSWWWLVLAFFAGGIGGVVLIAIFAAGRDEMAYRAGFQEGVEYGFEEGLKKITEVG